jgi:hypothetical protein
MNSNRLCGAGALLRHSLVAVLIGSSCFLFLWSAVPGTGAAQETLPLLIVPDGESGLALFGERCANCHGPLAAATASLPGIYRCSRQR